MCPFYCFILFYIFRFQNDNGARKKNNMLRKQSKHLPGGEGKNFGRGWVQPAKYYA